MRICDSCHRPNLSVASRTAQVFTGDRHNADVQDTLYFDLCDSCFYRMHDDVLSAARKYKRPFPEARD